MNPNSNLLNRGFREDAETNALVKGVPCKKVAEEAEVVARLAIGARISVCIGVRSEMCPWQAVGFGAPPAKAPFCEVQGSPRPIFFNGNYNAGARSVLFWDGAWFISVFAIFRFAVRRGPGARARQSDYYGELF